MTTRDVNGAEIRRIREDVLGLSLRQLVASVEPADAEGLSAPHLSKIERGLATPSPGMLQRIARALGVDLDAISTRNQGAA